MHLQKPKTTLNKGRQNRSSNFDMATMKKKSLASDIRNELFGFVVPYGQRDSSSIIDNTMNSVEIRNKSSHTFDFER